MAGEPTENHGLPPAGRAKSVDPLGLVMAKLKRLPQDRLQAAVVLEAFAGQKAPDSFAVSADHLPDSVETDEPTTMGTNEAPGARLTDFAVLFTIVASAILWIPRLRESLSDDIGKAVAVGLPCALALDGAIRIRHLSSGNVRSLRPTLFFLNAALAVALIASALVEPAVGVAVALVALWGEATILSVRGWYLHYVVLTAVTTAGLWILPWTVPVIVLTALVMIGLTTLAVLTDSGVVNMPENALASIAAFIIGGSSGLMLVADPGVWRSATYRTTAAVLLVTMTGWIASVRLTRIWVDLPSRMANAPIAPGRASPSGRAVSQAVVAASARIVVPTFVSLMIYIAVDADRGAIIVCAFSCFALATLAMSLNMATRYWAATAVIAATGATITILVPSSVSGLPLLLGSIFVVVASGTLAYVTFRDSTVAFTTRMIIR